jgi:hypothetical protein
MSNQSDTQIPLSKNQRAIHLLAKTCGRRLGRTRLTKALFLADYHGRRRSGRPITTYDYKYFHHGPWTEQIREDVQSLEALGLMREHKYVWVKGSGHYYTTSVPVDYPDLSPQELFILEAVADRCASGDLDDLLTEVYESPPMKLAKRVGKYARIPKEQFNRRETSAEAPDHLLRRAEAELDAGLGEDFRKVMNGLQARHFPDR